MTSSKYILIVLLLILVQSVKSQDVEAVGPAGIKFIFQPDNTIFPCKWRNNKINPEYIPIDKDEIQRTQAILEKSLAKYPTTLLKRNLKVIYILKSIFFYGLEYGGTYYKRKIYIANNGVENGYSDAYLEGSLHHEFSSILLNRYFRKFDEDLWLAANPDGFTYGKGGKEALQLNETGLSLDSTLFHDGFLNEYSLASLEEDFNCYAEYLFRNESGFWEAWESSEAIRKKTGILIRFYNRLDPVFTLGYFRGL